MLEAIESIENLQNQSEDNIHSFIRKRLAFSENLLTQLSHTNEENLDKEHRRFDMSGYENKTGDCTLHNMAIVNIFADMGIYDYTDYLFLDFHKGDGVLYLKYCNDNLNHAIRLGGQKTVEIIHEIFKRTIFSDRKKRRRD